jgi:hypothetical protein
MRWTEPVVLELLGEKKISAPALLGWAAGIYEGEGCFSMRWSMKNNKGKRYPAISIVSTDRDVLEKFQAVVKAGSIHTRTKTPKTSKLSKRQSTFGKQDLEKR